MRRYRSALRYLNNHHLAVIIKGHEGRNTLVADVGIQYSYPGIAIMPLVFNSLDEWHNYHLPEHHASQYHQHPDNEVPPPGSARFVLCSSLVALLAHAYQSLLGTDWHGGMAAAVRSVL